MYRLAGTAEIDLRIGGAYRFEGVHVRQPHEGYRSAKIEGDSMDTSMTETDEHRSVTGKCLCGVVQFEVQLPTRFCVHCHCSMCRRNHGAAFVTWFGVAKRQFRIVEGEPLLGRYRSSDHGERSFCSRCGTSLFCVLDRDPETIDIALATMNGAIDRPPQAHVFFDSHVEWVAVTDQLPKMGAV